MIRYLKRLTGIVWICCMFKQTTHIAPLSKQGKRKILETCKVNIEIVYINDFIDWEVIYFKVSLSIKITSNIYEIDINGLFRSLRV